MAVPRPPPSFTPVSYTHLDVYKRQEGGSAGGEIVAEGTPEQVAEVPGSFTGQYLKPLLEKDKLLQAKEQK